MQSFGKHLIFERPVIFDIMEFYFCGLFVQLACNYSVAQVTLEPTI